MNYLEFKRFFLQTNSDKAFILIASDLIVGTNFYVVGDYGVANDFTVSYQFETIVNTILNTHSSSDFVVAFASYDTILTLIDTCSTSDMENTWVITTSISGEVEVHNGIDMRASIVSLTNANVTYGDTGYASSGSASENIVIGYYVAELIAYVIVDMLIQHSITVSDYAKLDYGTAQELSLDFIHSTSLGSALSSDSSIDLEQIVYTFVHNYSALMDYVNTNDFKTIFTVITSMLSGLEQNGTSDFTSPFSATSNISITLGMIRDAVLSDYSSDYLSDLASSTLEALCTYED